MPDWAAVDEAARAGHPPRQRPRWSMGSIGLESRGTGNGPVVMVPEVSTLAKGSSGPRSRPASTFRPSAAGLPRRRRLDVIWQVCTGLMVTRILPRAL